MRGPSLTWEIPAFCRAPTIAQITALAADNLEAHAAMVTLQNNLLDSSYRRVPFFSAIDRLEAFLHSDPGRMPTINVALAAAQATITSVVTALLAENTALVAAQQQPPAVQPGAMPQPQYAGALDKDGQATTPTYIPPNTSLRCSK